MNPTHQQGSRLEPLSGKACEPCEPCEPYQPEKNSLAVNRPAQQRNGKPPDPLGDKLDARAEKLGCPWFIYEPILTRVTGCRRQFRDPLTAKQYRKALELLGWEENEPE